jgi:nucleoid-associated protein YejK
MDFRNKKITRLIIHKIIGKENFTSARAEVTNNVVPIDDTIENIIFKRLSDACSKLSRSFIVEIENEDKFLAKAVKMKNANDDEFIQISCSLARNLASSQTTKNATQGYLLVLQGQDMDFHTNFYALIKASFDKAVKPLEQEGRTIIELIDNVLLSSNQKLFKIGLINEIVSNAINTEYSCVLFDDQIRTGSKPAEYFYKDFLGFNVENNPKVQCKHFYHDIINFVKHNVVDKNIQLDIHNSLISYMKSYESSVYSVDFKNKFIPEELRDDFENKIVEKYPNPFIKDNQLIKTKLRYKTLTFGKENIKLTAPYDIFNEQVKIISTEQEIGLLEINPNYTIITINGKPFEQ